MNSVNLHLGIDIGSTTAKAVATKNGSIVFTTYQRHNTRIKESVLAILDQIKQKFPEEKNVKICLTGSAAMGIAEQQNLPFIQEVIAASEVIQKNYSNVRTLVDIGGEDAKIIFYEEGKSPDIRMNGSCAGGTGAFIDQIATLLNVETQELNSLAEQSTQIYTIASRCGVFAKTDVQNLIARKVPITDIAASCFHAVALQVINALSRGIDIEPNVLFIGGPLTYIPALQNMLRKLVNCTEENAFTPENSQLFPAWGSAIAAENDEKVFTIDDIYQRIENSSNIVTKNRLEALFANNQELQNWNEHRKIVPIPEKTVEFGQNSIDVFLGIDSGSTTTKVVLLDKDGNLIASNYDTNKGNPILAVINGLEACCKNLQCSSINIIRSAVTGYGEDLIRAAFNMDEGIVETIAHTTAAKKIEPNVSFILDIGGQDMKAIFIKNGAIQNVEINEACSSGCGSFIQNFAQTLNHTAESFGKLACCAPNPCDLGSRCTVFMNSQVKQALREGADTSEIAAGLAYSVIKNALFKVLQIKNMDVLGEKILVQGGTFKNPSIFRAMEKLTGKEIYSSNKPELMGALGAAYFAQTCYKNNQVPSSFIGYENRQDALSYTTRQINCRGCANNCIVTKFTFNNNAVHYSGNKCEKVFTSKGNTTERGENLYDFKYELLFNRDTNALNDVKNIKIGIPRILGMYSNFPFWNTLFTHSGIDVVLSDESTTKIYEKGQGTIMADNICFPAKLAHGHIFNLVDKNVDRIFYPLAIYEENEFKESKNSYNCPVVSSYSEVLDCAIPPEKRNKIPFDKPVITFRDEKLLKKSCWTYLKQFGISARTFENAFDEALREQKRYREQYKKKGFRILERAKQENRPIVMLAARPYHTDHLVHQKTSQILSELGASVVTEEIVTNIQGVSLTDYLHVAQWNYPNRIMHAAQWVIHNDEYNIHFVQMNSFGCGPDSFLSDEIKEYFEQAKKSYTFIRVDEINSTGSMRLRLRSLIETIKLGENESKEFGDRIIKKTPAFKENDKKRKILAPFFTKFVSPLIPPIFEYLGYDMETLPMSDKESVNIGLACSNNEICFPATLVIGDIIKALKSGKYDLDNTAVIMTQTGGQCRASNYLALIRRAILNNGITNVPVLSFATGGTQDNEQPGFEVAWTKVVKLILAAALFSDNISRMHYATIVREKEVGGTEKLTNSYLENAAELIRHNDHVGVLKLLKRAVEDYNAMAKDNCPRPQVGIVGEIYLKYNAYANMHVADWLISQGIEPRFPDLMDFFTQEFINLKINTKHNLRTTSLGTKLFADFLQLRYDRFEKKVEKIASKFKYYREKHSIKQEAENAEKIISLVNQFGEGWLIPAEIVSFSQEGVNNVVSLQPFGCIANHIISKGIEKKIKSLYPKTSLLFLDFDGNTSEANVFNRLHFLAQNAKNEFAEENKNS
ncbi:MAG: acyl-CoA dehydratase activase [Bacteroidales bacterium]|nr:acyl-CoA dehydratase activase [Bacteroidales bacterium]